MDRLKELKEARKEGLAEGKLEGRKEGLLEGRVLGKAEGGSAWRNERQARKSSRNS
ncbi:MAG: hypothetical protein P1P64_06070 [Treponemataceae bacterium]